MDKTTLIGIIIIIISYVTVWGFIIKSNNIIEKMNKNK